MASIGATGPCWGGPCTHSIRLNCEVVRRSYRTSVEIHMRKSGQEKICGGPEASFRV